jgi:hypothetical protein
VALIPYYFGPRRWCFHSNDERDGRIANEYSSHYSTYRCMEADCVLLPEKFEDLECGVTSGKGCEIYENTSAGRVALQPELLAFPKRGS